MASGSRQRPKKEKPIGVVFRHVEDRNGKAVVERRARSSNALKKRTVQVASDGKVEISSSRITTPAHVSDPLLEEELDSFFDDLTAEEPLVQNTEDNGGSTVRALSSELANIPYYSLLIGLIYSQINIYILGMTITPKVISTSFSGKTQPRSQIPAIPAHGKLRIFINATPAWGAVHSARDALSLPTNASPLTTFSSGPRPSGITQPWRT
jgi:hypothetical protein